MLMKAATRIVPQTACGQETEMTYDTALDTALNRLHHEGRYRTFINIERQRGRFPHATHGTAPMDRCAKSRCGVAMII